MLDHGGTVLAPVAGELVAAERRVGLDLVPGVDPHGSSLQALRDAVRTLHVTGLDPGGEAVDHVVADSHRIVLIGEPDDTAYGTEYLLLGNLHLIAHVGEDRGLVIEALRQLRIFRLAAAAEQPGTLSLPDLHVPLHLSQLLLGHEGPQTCREIERLADPELPRPFTDT